MSYLLLSSSSFLCLVEAAASELIEEGKFRLYRVRLKSRPSFGNTYLDLNLKRWSVIPSLFSIEVSSCKKESCRCSVLKNSSSFSLASMRFLSTSFALFCVTVGAFLVNGGNRNALLLLGLSNKCKARVDGSGAKLGAKFFGCDVGIELWFFSVDFCCCATMICLGTTAFPLAFLWLCFLTI